MRTKFVATLAILMLLGILFAAASTPRLRAQNARPAAANFYKPVLIPFQQQRPTASLQEWVAERPQGDGRWTSLGGPAQAGGLVMAVLPYSGGWLAAVSSPNWGSYPTIYRQAAGVDTWTPVGSSYLVRALANVGDTLFAALTEGGAGLARSDDGGATWQTAVAIDRPHELEGLAVNGQRVLAVGGREDSQLGRWAGLVLHSADGGQTWATVSVPGAPADGVERFMAVAIDPQDATHAVAIGRRYTDQVVLDSPVFASADGGATWNQIAQIDGVQVHSLIYHPTIAGRLYAGTGNHFVTWGPTQVYRSDDGGATWELVFGEGGGKLAFAAPSTVYACAEWGAMYRSQADGDAGSWEQIGGMPGCSAFALGASKALVGTWEHGLYSSVDLADWQDDNAGVTSLTRLTGIAVDPTNRQRLYVASPIGGGFASSDGGATWQTPNGLGVSLHSVAVDPAQPMSVLAGAAYDRDGALLRSADGGANFAVVYTAPFIQPDGSGGAEQISGLAFAPGNHLVVYAVGQDNINWAGAQAVVLSSADGGATWTRRLLLPADSWFEAAAVSAQNAQLVYAGGMVCDAVDGCRGALYRSADGGANWTRALTTDNTIASIVVNAADDNIVYVADRGYEVRRSTDGGVTWTVIRANWQAPEYPPSGYLLTADPHQPNRIYLGGWGYIAETADGGDTWSNWDEWINFQTPPMEPSALAVDFGAVEQTLYAGFNGLWAYTRLAPKTGDRYVATTGSDALNACTDPAAPCATVQHAIDVANPSETVLVAAGTYQENINVYRSVTLQGGYTADFRGRAPTPTVLDGSGIPLVPGAWDGEGVRFPAVIQDGGYKLYYNGYGLDGNNGIGLATSADGLIWTRHGTAPVLQGAPGAWDAQIESVAVLYRGFGNYKLWYSGYPGCAIGYATSLDGVNWSKYVNPVLQPGGEPWNNGCVHMPTVLFEDGIYKMWLQSTGDDGSGERPFIAYATSPDGENWTLTAQPVLGLDDLAWGPGWIWRPHVRHDGALYELWYSGWQDGGKIGYAASPDGLAWTDYASNPVLTGAPGAWDDGAAVDPAVLMNDGTLTLYYDNNQAIGAATSADGVNWTKLGDGPIFTPGAPTQFGRPAVRAWFDGLDYVLRDLTLTGGQGRVAGGVLVYGNSDVAIERCVVRDNWANGSQDSWGGAIVQNAGVLDIRDSWILGNTINQFGASAVRVGSAATFYLTNVLVAGNTGDAALHLNSGGMLVNVTIADNPDGPGVLFNADASQRLDIHNAIIWGNGDWIHTPGDGVLVVSHSDVQGGVWPGTNNISADPLFVGPHDYHLRFGSPAVDHGRGFAGGASDHDLDGRRRPQDGDLDGVARFDMGAYELPSFRVVTPIVFKAP